MSFRISDSEPLYYGESEYYRYSSLKGYEDECYQTEMPAVKQGKITGLPLRFMTALRGFFSRA